MQLVQERKLRLDDRIGQFVPGLPWGQKITLAELLDMTSGIVDYLSSRGRRCSARTARHHLAR